MAKAITACESKRSDHRLEALKLLAAALPFTGGAIRLGLSGPPGVGKSTLIERFGLSLLEAGHRVAVFTIDPSSPLHQGSLLADKTRMPRLAAHPQAFIRPSPSSGHLGGTASATREAMLMAEAAGYDRILVETVGVGQSEVAIASMVDFFVLLQQPGAGDELQGIKKGILELADLVVVTKCDGDQLAAAQRSAAQLRQALALVNSHRQQQALQQVLEVSAVTGAGIEALSHTLINLMDTANETGTLASRRQQQQTAWFDQDLQRTVLNLVFSEPSLGEQVAKARQKALNEGQLPPLAAWTLAHKLLHLS